MIRFSAAIALAGSAMLAGCAMNVPVGRSFVHLAGTEWRIVEVNGRPTPPGGDYSMRFGHDRSFAVRFGCNHMGGSYRSVVGTLTVSDLSATRMGCPEPAMSFENQGSVILAQQLRVIDAGNGQVILGSDAGTIALAPTR